jgi:hypothetical protein
MGRPNVEPRLSALRLQRADPRVKAFNNAEADSWLRLAELVAEKQSGRTDKPSARDEAV